MLPPFQVPAARRRRPQLTLDVTPNCSLWLADIGEPRNNDLRVVVVEASREPEPRQTALGLATRVRPAAGVRAFEITWYAYVAYGVRNESYFRAEEGEQPGPHQLATRKDSAFLSYVAATTFAKDDFPGPLIHWSLHTDWHCIDVVGVDAPEVRQLEPPEVATLLAAYVD